MQSELIIRFDYGSVVPWVRRTDGGIHAIAGPDTLWLHTPVEHHGENLTTVAEFTVEPGERVPFDAHLASFLSSRRRRSMTRRRSWPKTIEFWAEWAGPLHLPRARGASRRPLAHHAQGADLQADRRHRGGRDHVAARADRRRVATGITATAGCATRRSRSWPCSMRLHATKPTAWREWLLRAVAGDPSTVQIMYGLAGERRLDRVRGLDWLPGYEKSKPVRIGNAASRPVPARRLRRSRQRPVPRPAWPASGPATAATAGTSARRCWSSSRNLWTQPDEGIWEVRGPRQHFVHSKVMAWVAIDRGIKAAEKFGLDGPAGPLASRPRTRSTTRSAKRDSTRGIELVRAGVRVGSCSTRAC